MKLFYTMYKKEEKESIKENWPLDEVSFLPFS